MDRAVTERLFALSTAEVYQYRSEPFTLASGRRSHHYFNGKKITLNPERLALLAEAIRDEIVPEICRLSGIERFEATGGLTLGADPIAYAVVLAFWQRGERLSPLVVRKEAKGHGTGQQIEGEFATGDRVLVLDDVVTTGGSTLRAVHALRAAGLECRVAVAIIDREEGAREALAAEGVELFSLWRKSDFDTRPDPA